MAYTYDNFTTAAKTAGLMDKLTEQDLKAAQKNPEFGLSLLSLMKDSTAATTAEQKLLATEAANQLRKSYGAQAAAQSSGGAYRGNYEPQIKDLMGKISNYGSFDYANQDQYQKLLGQLTNYGSFSYDNQTSYQKLLDSLVNQKAFSYDPTEDPSFSAYKKTYMREGDRASANALAQASAASGGRASSYALTAAQQAGNYYAGKLSDMLPTLEQNAYSRYLSDISNRLNSLNALESDRAFDYQDYLNRFGQLQSGLGALENDRAFDYEKWMNEYNMLQNSLSNYQGQDATDYQRYLDEYNLAYQAERDRLAQEQLQYENQQAESQQRFQNAMALYQLLGYATPEVAAVLGINPTDTSVVGTPDTNPKPTPALLEQTPNPQPETDPDEVLLPELEFKPIEPQVNESEEVRKIKALQNALGVAQTGSYDRDTAAAALKKGYSTMDSAYEALVGSGSLSKAKQNEIVDYVQGLLDSGTSASWQTKNIINNSSRWNAAEKAYALDVLKEYLNSGYMLR